MSVYIYIKSCAKVSLILYVTQTKNYPTETTINNGYSKFL